MLSYQPLNLHGSARVCSYYLAHDPVELGCILYRFVSEDIPSPLPNLFQKILVVGTLDVMKMPGGMAYHRHVHQQLFAILLELAFVHPAFDLRIRGESAVHRVLLAELGDVLVPTVSDEHWRIVGPGVAGRGTQQDPPI